MPAPRPLRCAAPLEDRTAPALLVGLTSANALVRIDSAAPSKVLSTFPVTGLQPGESLLGIDYRPADGTLYGLGSSSRVYRLTPSGAATAVGAPFTPSLSGGDFGFDFNPAVDKLRVTSDTGQNLRLNADTGAVVSVDTGLAYDAATFAAVVGGTPPAPDAVGAGYTNTVSPATGKVSATQYVIDANLDILATQGGVGGTPSPNGGTLFPVGNLGFDAGQATGFDVEPGTPNAFATRVSGSGTEIYAVNLSTGAGTLLGTAGNVTLRGLAVAPAGAPGATRFAVGAGAGGGPQVAVYDAQTKAQLQSFFPFEETFSGGVTVATGDVTADGIPDLVVGTGVGGGPRVVVYDGATKAAIADFFAYEASFRGGVNVAVGDVDGDGQGDVLVGSGVGGGPRVVVFGGATLKGTPTAIADFFAYESTFRGGVTVAAGDYNGDGAADVVAGSGAGGGPRVVVYDGDFVTAEATVQQVGAGVLADYFAYDEAFRDGVNVAAADVDGDGVLDVVTGTGVGGGPLVRAFAGLTTARLANLSAFDDKLRGGVRVASADVGGDGSVEILAASGPGGPPTVKALSLAGATVATFDALAANFTGGVFVG